MNLKNLNDSNRRELSRKYGKAVDTVHFYKGGVCADIFMQRDTLYFSAHIAGNSTLLKDGAQVKKWALDQLKAVCDFVWTPVISVLDVDACEHTYGHRRLQLHSISLDVDRFYVAVLPNGDFRAVDWDVPVEGRLLTDRNPSIWLDEVKKSEDGKTPVLPCFSRDIHLMPYSEPLWLGLNALCKGITDLSTKLHELLISENGAKRLADVGARAGTLLLT